MTESKTNVDHILEWLGVKPEEVTWGKTTGTLEDSPAMTALFKAHAWAEKWLKDSKQVIELQITGEVTPEKEERRRRAEDFMNYYLTEIDKGFTSRMCEKHLYMMLYGCLPENKETNL